MTLMVVLGHEDLVKLLGATAELLSFRFVGVVQQQAPRYVMDFTNGVPQLALQLVRPRGLSRPGLCQLGRHAVQQCDCLLCNLQQAFHILING